MNQELATTDQVRMARQADNDEHVLGLWLHGRAPHTQRAYRADVRRFLKFVYKPLSEVRLGDIQRFADSLLGIRETTLARTLAAVKSLLAFAHRIGYLPFNVGAPIHLPKAKNTLAERILPEGTIHKLLSLEPDGRNRVLLRLLYVAGLRVSEICALNWQDAQKREDDSGQITVFGKGGKTRVVFLPASMWLDLVSLRSNAGSDGPVFRSRKGGRLSECQVLRIVRQAAKRAGVTVNVSPHWLRHAHASHAIERGAPIHLVQATLGHGSVATTGRYLHARPADSSARFLAL